MNHNPILGSHRLQKKYCLTFFVADGQHYKNSPGLEQFGPLVSQIIPMLDQLLKFKESKAI
jgi:hypothetical protein